jgi:hypothetical protein
MHQERGAHAASPPTEDDSVPRWPPTRQMRQVERTCKATHMKIKAKTAPDVLVRNEGTVFLFCPLTPRAKQWIDQNVRADTSSPQIAVSGKVLATELPLHERQMVSD